MIRRALISVPQRVVSLPGLQAEVRHASTASCASQKTVFQDERGRGWHLISSVCVERLPVITAQMTEIEAKFFKYLQQKDHENSLKCDHELRHERDKGTLQHDNKTPMDGIDYTKQEILTATEIEDIWKEELTSLELAPRSYDDSDVKSIDRKLDKNLTLVVEQTFGTHKSYLLPQTRWQPGESMRDTAERALKTLCGPDFKVLIYGNVPFGFYKYSYPKKYQTDDIYGAKVFYFLGKYREGNLQKSAEYKWLDRNELSETLSNPIAKSVSKFLLPD